MSTHPNDSGRQQGPERGALKPDDLLERGADASGRLVGGGWLGRLDLGFEVRAGRTVLAHKRQVGPLTVQRPFYPEGDSCQLYLLHPPGGLVGGDRIEIRLDVAAGASVLVTTPGAAKFYRSAGTAATVQQGLRIAAGGLLEWFPQENILFPGAQARTRTSVELAGDARFIGWEIQSLGRPVTGERFDPGTADLEFRLDRDGRPMLRDRLRVNTGQALDGPSSLRGFPVCGTFVATGVEPGSLEVARAALSNEKDHPTGLTLIEDLLVARCLAPGVESVSRIFRSLWGILRPRLMGRDTCPPRIWST
ncbi:urease accessory protein UreD [Candidatus Thiosymbion oneisti]|uniref:urease accessory protein UreD n=1 Tax=Candidatus Thiosymbion oneisti TaxID=589554 RepID=UPI000B7CF602|nr:urease accessory protein UreD [Candidatus Thiosymbion oneisti]